MADYGLKVVSQTGGGTQIGSDYANYAYRAHGTAHITNFYAGAWRYGNVTVPGSTGVVALRGDCPACLLGMYRSGANTVMQILIDSSPGIAPYVTWYVFNDPANAPVGASDKYGLLVKDASGIITYDSRKKYLRFLDSHVKQAYPKYPSSNTYSYTSGAVPAVIQGNLGTSLFEAPTSLGVPDFMEFRTADFFRVDGNRVIVYSSHTADGPYQKARNPPQIYKRNGTYTMVDVARIHQ